MTTSEQIPRIFHRIWLGSRPMPRAFVEYGKTWSHLHPQWEMKLWTDINLPELINREYFNKYASFAIKSDILRYEVLYTYGGIYVDTDFQCLKSFEPLIQAHTCLAGEESPELLSNALIGATPHHPFLDTVIHNIPDSIREHDYVSPLDMDPLDTVGIFYFNRCAWGRTDVTRLPPSLLYPYHFTEKHKQGMSFPDAYAVHHWACSWS